MAIHLVENVNVYSSLGRSDAAGGKHGKHHGGNLEPVSTQLSGTSEVTGGKRHLLLQ